MCALIAAIEKRPIQRMRKKTRQNRTRAFPDRGEALLASGPEGSDDKKTPATGDGSNPAFWAILFAASGAVLIGAVAYDRKREYNE